MALKGGEPICVALRCGEPICAVLKGGEPVVVDLPAIYLAAMPIASTHYDLPGQTSVYHGKVRDVYRFHDRVLLVASDRISAFDHILPEPIPHKGAVLNGVATHFLRATEDLVPNWLLDVPHANAAYGRYCEPIKLEMVVRGYLAGHAWRTYRAGGRTLCGEVLPEGLREADPFPQPIITPATKADAGHDEDISRHDIIARGIVSEPIYEQLEQYALALFARGTAMAAKRGLLLVDTKYEFGMHQGQVYLIDEVHTPDSSRYYVAEGFAERQAKGDPQRQLSKEFVREWLMQQGFQGLDGQQMPQMPSSFVREVSERYIELYERLTGQTFARQKQQDTAALEAVLREYISAKHSR